LFACKLSIIKQNEHNMLTFFRRIRKGLLDNGNTSRYFVYAVGEIALVVIGILIALQINNLNDQAKESQTEEMLLIQLESDLQKSLIDIKLNIRIHNKVEESSNILINHIDQDLSYHDSLAFHFASAFLWSRLVINEGAYETIKSHGVEIISNIELRKKMIDIFGGNLYFLRELERLTQDYCEKMRTTNFEKYFEASYVDFGPSEEGFSYGKCIPLNYNKLKKDKSYWYHLITFQNLSQTLQNTGNKPYKKKLEKLIALVGAELNNKK